MSTGGVFQLISNDGIQDQLLMATNDLTANIMNITRNKLSVLSKQNPKLSVQQLIARDTAWMPTLAAIEQSHIVFINATFKPFASIAHEYSKTGPRGGKASLGTSCVFALPIVGDFINDTVLYVKLTGLSAKNSLDKVRYVEYLGHRLMQKVSFKVSKFALDSYTSDVYNVHYQFKVPTDKNAGYLRNIGQEIPHQGYLTADPTVDEWREYRYFGDGPQTFKNQQSVVEMWIPLLFWFKDVQNSLPNFLLPMQQTEIEVNFEDQANLIAWANYGGGGLYNVPTITDCFLYMNHIFLLPQLTKIFINRFGFSLIRVHRQHQEQLTTSQGSVLLHNLKWPVECMYVGFRPRVNLNNSQTWYKNTSLTQRSIKEAVVTGISTIEVNDAIYYDEQQVVSTLGIRAQDITIYPNIGPEFYNNYIPYQYGPKLKTPDELGWYMINFNFFPGEYQPSGHFNISRARELYLDYQSAINPDTNQYIIQQSNPVDLIVIADCINFLLCINGSATLRFAT
jgi:hypothetical protein